MLPGRGGLLPSHIVLRALATPIPDPGNSARSGWPARSGWFQARTCLQTLVSIEARRGRGSAPDDRGDLLPSSVRGGAYRVETVTASGALHRQEFSDSLIERSLGRFGGWQMVPGRPAQTHVEVRSASGALISRARGASLGAVEADVLTWLLAQWVQAGCSPDGVIHTTLYQLTAALYGSRAKGTEDRRAVAGALFNLHTASITVSDYDSATDDELAGRWVDVHLVKRIHYGEQLQALQDRQHVSAAELGALRGETLSIYIDDWLIGRLQRDKLRAWLDWPVQRRLGAGMAKRLWLFLEPHPGYRALRDRPQFEGTLLELTDEVYAELGANCRERRDNRKSIRRGIDRIREIDERYVLLEFRPGKADLSDCVRVIRRVRAPVPA